MRKRSWRGSKPVRKPATPAERSSSAPSSPPRALKDPKISKWLASTLRKHATRDVDQKEIAGLLADLDARAQSAGAGEA